jgi:hypothetical protein
MASLAFFAFIPFAIAIYGRLPRARAAVLVVLTGSLFLPEFYTFDLPLFRPLDKDDIAYLGAMIGAVVYHSRRVSGARFGLGPESLVILIVLANLGTVLANPSAMWDEGRLEDGLTFYDVVSQAARDALSFALPFFVGRALFSSREDLRTLLSGLAVAGLVYAGLMAAEVVLSIPFRVFQLSRLVYGFSAGVSFRWGVIQPTVFMEHGLSIATFMAACLLAVVGLARAGLTMPLLKPVRAWPLVYAGLFLSRNVAGNVYGLSLSAVLATCKAKTIARVSVLLALLVISYPSLRMFDVFPAKGILNLAGKFDEERRRSLAGRFDEEQYVIDLMGDRFWWGWGNIMRVPGAEGLRGWQGGGFEGGLDGYWVIELGVHGALGMALRLSPLLLPIFLAARRMRKLRSEKERVLLATLMAIVAMRSVDLLINGWWNNLPVFLAGALYSFAGSLGNVPTGARRRRREEEAEALPEPLSAGALPARRGVAPR